MERHKKHYSPAETEKLLKAKKEVDELMANPSDKRFINKAGGIWYYISKMYFDGERKPNALSEQYRKECAKLVEEPADKAAPVIDDRQLSLLPQEDTPLLSEQKETNRLLGKLVEMREISLARLAQMEERLTKSSEKPNAPVIPIRPPQNETDHPPLIG